MNGIKADDAHFFFLNIGLTEILRLIITTLYRRRCSVIKLLAKLLGTFTQDIPISRYMVRS